MGMAGKCTRKPRSHPRTHPKHAEATPPGALSRRDHQQDRRVDGAYLRRKSAEAEKHIQLALKLTPHRQSRNLESEPLLLLLMLTERKTRQRLLREAQATQASRREWRAGRRARTFPGE